MRPEKGRVCPSFDWQTCQITAEMRGRLTVFQDSPAGSELILATGRKARSSARLMPSPFHLNSVSDLFDFVLAKTGTNICQLKIHYCLPTAGASPSTRMVDPCIFYRRTNQNRAFTGIESTFDITLTVYSFHVEQTSFK
jgi:hypothetical protein